MIHLQLFLRPLSDYGSNVLDVVADKHDSGSAKYSKVNLLGKFELKLYLASFTYHDVFNIPSDSRTALVIFRHSRSINSNFFQIFKASNKGCMH